MRNNIPTCKIINDNNKLAKEFISSIRYSTHCIYNIEYECFDFSKYKYLFKNNNEKYDFLIEVKNSNVIIGNDINDINDINSDLINLTKYINEGSELSLFLLFNYNSRCITLGLIEKDKDNIYCHDHNKVNFSIILREIENKLSSNICNKIINIKIKSDQSIYINKYLCPIEFKNLRKVGINIPLVIMQNFYNRNVKTFKFLESNNKESAYNLSRYSDIFFDLDETLIWQGEPIDETITLLKFLYENNFKINLLTRHKKNIYNTLESINLDYKLFNKIIKVEDNQRKSEFITENSLFIDNEFPERYDVRFNASTVSLDLDQLEFIIKC